MTSTNLKMLGVGGREWGRCEKLVIVYVICKLDLQISLYPETST